MSEDAQSDDVLHQRLLARDPIASEEVAARHLESIRRYVRARAFAHGISDAELVNDAAVDALFNYIRHPEKFDPAKSRLSGYLNRAAERDLINELEKRRRRRRGEELTDDVELAIFRGNKPSDIKRITRGESPAAVIDEQNQRLEVILEALTDAMDRKLVKMMADGERHTSAFAAVLQISNLPVAQQKRIVKQHKDRLKQKLKRMRGGLNA